MEIKSSKINIGKTKKVILKLLKFNPDRDWMIMFFIFLLINTVILSSGFLLFLKTKNGEVSNQRATESLLPKINETKLMETVSFFAEQENNHLDLLEEKEERSDPSL